MAVVLARSIGAKLFLILSSLLCPVRPESLGGGGSGGLCCGEGSISSLS